MKTILPLVLCLWAVTTSYAQITTSIIKANFGVDADLRSNFFNNFPQSGNDDWFSLGTAGSGNFVIDTSGASARMTRYAWDMAYRRLPFFKTMRFDPYTTVNNRLLIDAVFIRDYHGDDSTVFASGSNKNGMNPSSWTTPVSQSVPDKNDILDMMVHVRRAGPNTTDSLWMFGGLSIENTTGNRYFDFEMYQTDIYYDRASRRFYGYGSDDGHTSWKFDNAGNITRPGDIIFTAEYGGSGLALVEARIWVNNAELSKIPVDFNWTGQFDGASNGATYGYASIAPKTSGAYYTGLQSVGGTWPGPFGIILGDNSMPATYTARQFMEFSVNLTKLGLDPVTLLGGNACGMPFRRVLVKSRSSSSFTAELKDFVGPFDLFLAPRADIQSDVTMFCGSIGISNLQVKNPVSTSVYTWYTPNGHIVGPNTGINVVADMPGMYIVNQQLQSGCSTYASDTVVITYDAGCSLLENNLTGLTVSHDNGTGTLDWTVLRNAEISYFNIEYSTDGIHFLSAGQLSADTEFSSSRKYSFDHNLAGVQSPVVYYRVIMYGVKGSKKVSRVVKLSIPANEELKVTVLPNPVTDFMQVTLSLPVSGQVDVLIHDIAGRSMYQKSALLPEGLNTMTIPHPVRWPAGVYTVTVRSSGKLITEKLIVQKH